MKKKTKYVKLLYRAMSKEVNVYLYTYQLTYDLDFWKDQLFIVSPLSI